MSSFKCLEVSILDQVCHTCTDMLCHAFCFFKDFDLLLVWLLQHYEGDVEELCLDFTVTEESFGKRQVIELKPDGKDVTVINKNKMQYIHAIADYKLNRQVYISFLFN